MPDKNVAEEKGGIVEMNAGKGKRKDRSVKKKIITEETIEGEAADEYPPGEPGQEEDVPSEYVGRLPRPVHEMLYDIRDSIGPEYSEWTIGLDRWGPRNHKKYILKLGGIRHLDFLISLREVRALLEQEHGGGTYYARILKNGRIIDRIRIEIESPPKLTPEDMKETKDRLEGEVPESDTDGEAEQYKQQKKALEAKMALKRTEAEYKHMLREIEPEEGDGDEGEEDIPFPGAQIPGAGFGPYSPHDLKAKLEREIEQKYERRLDRVLQNMRQETEIEKLRAEIRELKDAPPRKDNTDTIITAIKTIAEKFNPFEMAIRLAEAIKPQASSQGEDQKMMAFANMLTSQMQSINQLTMSSFQSLMSTQGQLTKQMIDNAMAPQGERNWKLELVEKGMETVKSFAGDLFDFNKGKQEITKKELDLIAEGKIARKPLPAPKAQQAPPPSPVPAAAPRPVQATSPLIQTAPQPVQPQPEIPPEQVVEIYQRANSLLNEAVGAFLAGQSPKFFARRTLEIAGQDVTMFLMENGNVETIRGIAAQQGRLEEFDKWVFNNSPAREWVETWLGEISRNYRPVSAGHAEPPKPESNEFSGYYDNIPKESAPIPPGMKPIEMRFIPESPKPEAASPQEKFQEKAKNIEGQKSPGEMRPKPSIPAQRKKAARPQPVEGIGVMADSPEKGGGKPASGEGGGTESPSGQNN